MIRHTRPKTNPSRDTAIIGMMQALQQGAVKKTRRECRQDAPAVNNMHLLVTAGASRGREGGARAGRGGRGYQTLEAKAIASMGRRAITPQIQVPPVVLFRQSELLELRAEHVHPFLPLLHTSHYHPTRTH